MQGLQVRKVLIIGAGIGGLSVALALRRAGIEARVFERADDLGQLQAGNGFFLWSNGVRALHHLGIADRLLAVASPPLQHFEIRTPSGRQLVDLSLSDMERRAGIPCVGVPRGELHRVLSDAVDQGVVQTGAACTGFTQDERSVTAQFADGKEEQGDLLIGADGLRSVIRSHVLGNDEPNYAGYSLWFSIVESDFASLRVFRTFLGRGIRFTFLPVGPNRLTWVSIANAPPGGRDDRSGLKDMLLSRHQGWMEPVEKVISDTDESKIYRLDSYSRTPVDHWSKGRVTVLGDAAHPMTFNLAQGSCQAMEDAVVLAQCLGQNTNVPTALQAYERRRTDRTADITKVSDRIGAAGAWENPVACMARSHLLRLFQPLVVKKLRKLALHDF